MTKFVLDATVGHDAGADNLVLEVLGVLVGKKAAGCHVVKAAHSKKFHKGHEKEASGHVSKAGGALSALLKRHSKDTSATAANEDEGRGTLRSMAVPAMQKSKNLR